MPSDIHGGGLPSYPWLKVVDARPPQDGEWIIDDGGSVRQHRYGACWPRLLVAPNNVYGAYRLEDIKIREGYEANANSLKVAFHIPEDGELYANSFGGVEQWSTCDLEKCLALGMDLRRLCLRKIKPQTKKWVVLESCDEKQVRMYERLAADLDYWSVRFEERPA